MTDNPLELARRLVELLRAECDSVKATTNAAGNCWFDVYAIGTLLPKPGGQVEQELKRAAQDYVRTATATEAYFRQALAAAEALVRELEGK